MDQFDALQSSLAGVWPAMTLRTTAPQLRTIVMLHSVPADIMPPQLAPVVPAYEERFLAVVVSLLRAPGSRLIYLTSQPIMPRIVDYWLSLIPGIDVEEARSRLFLISPVDGSPRPLADKLLDRPRLLERIRRLVIDPRLAVIVPFICRESEARLGLALGIPVYGSNPNLWRLGGKSAGRRIFRDEGVPLPEGVEDVRSVDDLLTGIAEVRGRRPDASRAIVKLDQGLGGYGNATVDLRERDLRRAIETMTLEDDEKSPESYVNLLSEGAVVEELLEGVEFRSPSVQLRNSPMQEVEVLSTHDQTLGGRSGMTFLGSRFPADVGYGPTISEYATRVGRRLAKEGVLGRYALDFVSVRSDENAPWRSYAVEANLRCGGTTHTFMALQTLTDGEFDVANGTFTDSSGRLRYYAASDHLEHPAYASLTPDDLFDILHERRLGWDDRTMTGVALHMASALAVAGRVGVTAVASNHGHADALLEAVRHALDVESGALLS